MFINIIISSQLIFMLVILVSSDKLVNSSLKLITNPVRNSFYHIGDTLNLLCQIKDEQKSYHLSWSLPLNSEHHGPDKSRIKMKKDVNSLNVTIIDLHYNDSGWYFCEAKDLNDNVIDKKSIHITVQKNFNNHCTLEAHFDCGNDFCILKEYVCDGLMDCPDERDEDPNLCGSMVCNGKIDCNDGRCLSLYYCCNSSLNPYCSSAQMLPCCYDYLQGKLNLYSDHKIDNEIFIRNTINSHWIRTSISTYICFIVVMIMLTSMLFGAIYKVRKRAILLSIRQYQEDHIHQQNHSHNLFVDLSPNYLSGNSSSGCQTPQNFIPEQELFLNGSPIPKPPDYNEALYHQIMPVDDPPPPYSPPN